MRNQAENAIDPHRTHHVDVANNAWSSPVRSTHAQHEAVGLRREAQQNALSSSQPFANGATRKRPFLADCDYSNEFETSNGNVAKRALNSTKMSNEQLYKRSNSQQPQQGNFKSLAAERERERERDRGHATDAFLTPPVIKSNPFLYAPPKHPTFADLQPIDNASSCASWAPAPSPAPPFSSNFQLNLPASRPRNNSPLFGSSATQHFQQPRTNKDVDSGFVAPASPPSPFKQPGNALSAGKSPRCALGHSIRPDLEAKFKEYNRNNSLIEKFGLNFSRRRETPSGSTHRNHENVFNSVNDFIYQFGNVMQKRGDGRRPDKEQDGANRLGIMTSELLDQFRTNGEFKKPDVYRCEAKRLKHFADSVTSAAPTLAQGDVQSLMVALVKIGTYTEAVLVFILCAAAMESKPKRYKAEQCAEFYSGLLPLVQYMRNLAQTYQASRMPNEEEFSGDPLADLLFFGAHSVSYLIDSYLHVKMFDARKSVLETALQRIDEMKNNLKMSVAAASQPNCARLNANGELSDSASNTSISSGYLSNLSSPLNHRNAARNAMMPAASRADMLHDHDERYSKERAEEKSKYLEDMARYETLSDQYEAALRDMALICRAFDLREEAFDLVRKIRALNVVFEGEHKRKWKRIVNFSKWPPFSVQHLALDEFISYVRMFTSTLMSTVLALSRQHGDQQLRKKR